MLEEYKYMYKNTHRNEYKYMNMYESEDEYILGASLVSTTILNNATGLPGRL